MAFETFAVLTTIFEKDVRTMKITKKILLASAACAALFTVAPAMAETVTTTTIVHQKDIPDTEKVNFSAFDLNGDGVLSMPEVGTELFYIFDTDDNEVIDNLEFNHKQVMTIIPMEKEVYTYTDWDNDGDTDETAFTHEMFFNQSGLMRFDENMDGLSAADFINKSMLELDTDESTVIELDEWQQAYQDTYGRPVSDQDRYN